MIRSQGTVASPSDVSNTNTQGFELPFSESFCSTRFAVVLYMHSSFSPLIARIIKSRLPSLARLNSSRRFTIMTVLFSARANAFSIAASPAPTTTIVSSAYSSGSSKWYWTCGRFSPATPSLRKFPCTPIAMTMFSATIVCSSAVTI